MELSRQSVVEDECDIYFNTKVVEAMNRCLIDSTGGVVKMSETNTLIFASGFQKKGIVTFRSSACYFGKTLITAVVRNNTTPKEYIGRDRLGEEIESGTTYEFASRSELVMFLLRYSPVAISN